MLCQRGHGDKETDNKMGGNIICSHRFLDRSTSLWTKVILWSSNLILSPEKEKKRRQKQILIFPEVDNSPGNAWGGDSVKPRIVWWPCDRDLQVVITAVVGAMIQSDSQGLSRLKNCIFMGEWVWESLQQVVLNYPGLFSELAGIPRERKKLQPNVIPSVFPCQCRVQLPCSQNPLEMTEDLTTEWHFLQWPGLSQHSSHGSWSSGPGRNNLALEKGTPWN